MRSTVFTLLSLATMLSLTCILRAEDTLIIELPSSQKALAARAMVKAQHDAAIAAAAKAQSSRPGLSASRGSLPSRSGTPDRDRDRVVGRLGEVEQQTPIFRTQHRSGRLATVEPGTYLAIRDDSANWFGVLMADGTTGWVSKAQVKLLDYQVVSNGAPSLPNFGEGGMHARTGGEFFSGDPQSLLNEAYKYMGVPYVWGGNTASGIDCSGFMKKIFAANGYPLPRTAAEQTSIGMPIDSSQLQCGDRLYFGHGGRITHTGLYIGNGYFIHSSAGEHGVAISKLTEGTYARIFMCARR